MKTVKFNEAYYLSYAEYGNPDGAPILIQHGMIASIKDGHLFQRLVESGAYVICPARPGYGMSSPYPMKNVADWADIISVLVQDLNLSQFDVLGISSGAPYSYAIGHALPEQVRNVFILSGTPALFDQSVLSFWPYKVDKDARFADLQKLAYELFFAHLSRYEMERDEIKDSQMNDCFGVALDLKIRCNDWGFPLNQVKVRVLMRHSKADSVVPLKTAELTAKMLPNCHLEVRETDPHFSQEVLDDFISEIVSGNFDAEP